MSDIRSFETQRRNVGDGWQPIIEKLHSQLLDLDPGYQILQIKEKFGGLRYYFSGSKDYPADPDTYEQMTRLVDEAELESIRTCEDCGNDGCEQSIGGWWRTLCDGCAEQALARREAMWRERDDVPESTA